MAGGAALIKVKPSFAAWWGRIGSMPNAAAVAIGDLAGDFMLTTIGSGR
jgi:hypothetical protein